MVFDSKPLVSKPQPEKLSVTLNFSTGDINMSSVPHGHGVSLKYFHGFQTEVSKCPNSSPIVPKCT